MTNPYKRLFAYYLPSVGEGNKPIDFEFDVYDVLKAFNVTCPAVSHAVKKLLCAGQRGHKTKVQDLNEAAEAIRRAVELADPGAA